MKELAVIIPIYNEEQCIESVLMSWIIELKKLNISFEIHAFDDGSKDQSRQVIEKISRKNKEVICHEHKNSGHGPTVLKGYKKLSSFEWIFQVDSDGEFSPKDFEALWQERTYFDFILGKRSIRNGPLIRKLISLVAQWSVGILFSKGIQDVNSPYRLMRREVIKHFFKIIPDDSFAPNLLISGLVNYYKLPSYELEVSHQKRRTGEVSIRGIKALQSAFKSFWQTLRFRFTFRKKMGNDNYLSISLQN